MEGAEQSWVAALSRYRDPAAEQEHVIYEDDWFRSLRKLVRTSRAFDGCMDAGEAPGDGAADGPAAPPAGAPPRKLHTPMDYVRRLNGRVRPPWALGADAGDPAEARQRSGKRISWLRPSTDAQHAADPPGPHPAGVPPSASAPEVAAAPNPILNARPLPTSESSAQLGVRRADGPSPYESQPNGGAMPSGSQPPCGFQSSSTDAGASPLDRRVAGAQAAVDPWHDRDAGRATPLPVAAPALHVSDFPPWTYAPPARNAWGTLPQTPMGAGTRAVREPTSTYGVATSTSPAVASALPGRAPAGQPAYTQADGHWALSQQGAIRRQTQPETQPESPLVNKSQAPGQGRVLMCQALAPGRDQVSQCPAAEPTWASRPPEPEQRPALEPTGSQAPAPAPAPILQPPAPVPEPQLASQVPGPMSQPPAQGWVPGPMSQPPAATQPPAGDPQGHSPKRRSVSDTTSMLPPSSRRTSTGAYRWRTPGNTMSMLRAPLRDLPPMASPPSGGLPPMPEAIPSDGAPLHARGLTSDGRPRPVSMSAGVPPTAPAGRHPVSMAAAGGGTPGLRPLSFCPEALDARRPGVPTSKKEPAAHQRQADKYPAHLDPAYSFLPRSVAEMRESLQAARRRTIAADASTEQVSFGVAV